MTRSFASSRRATVSALAAGLACAVACASAAEERTIVRDGAQVRTEKAFQGQVVAEPPRGTRVTCEGRANEWVAVMVPGGARGWLHEVFLGPSMAESPAPALAPIGEPQPPPSDDPCRADRERAWRLEADLSSASHARAQVATLDAQVASLDAQVASLGAQVASLRAALDACQRESARRDAPPSDDAARAGAELQRAGERIRTLEEELVVVRSELATERKAADEVRRSYDDREIVARADERERADGRHAEELAEIDTRHEATMARFLEYVTTRHDAALARERASLEEDCRVRLSQERQAHVDELRKVSKQSGWEAEMAKAVRAGVEKEIANRLEQQEVRLEAKCRGAQVDLDRSLRDQQARLEAECEGKRIASVGQALAALRAELEERARADREREELRCQLALELVLESAAAGGDVQTLRQRIDQRRAGGDASSGAVEGQP